MLLLTILLFTFLVLLLFMSIFSLKVAFTFNSEQVPNIHILATWLNRLFKGIIIQENESFLLNFYVFNRKVFSKTLKDGKGNYTEKLNLLKSIEPYYIKVNAAYGFEDPSITGMVCGSIDLISSYINISEISNTPNFNIDSDYFNINGEVELNLLLLIVKVLKYKKSNLTIHTAQSSR